MKAAVTATNALHPACVVVTGDLVDNPGIPLQDSVYHARLAELEAPVYEVQGNHDARDYPRFSFREHGCAFIGIDSNCIKEDTQDVEAAQWAWLESELKAAKECRYTFVFLHCPILRETLDEAEDYFNFPFAKREKYIALFKENGVDAVFAGHCHQDYDTLVEGIRFVTAGPVANALGHGTPGFNVIRVSDSGLDVTYTPTPGVDPTHCRF